MPNLTIARGVLIDLLNTELIVSSWQRRQRIWNSAEFDLLSTTSFELLRLLHYDYVFEHASSFELFETSWIKELLECQEDKALRSNDAKFASYESSKEKCR